jgi:hemoglobin
MAMSTRVGNPRVLHLHATVAAGPWQPSGEIMATHLRIGHRPRPFVLAAVAASLLASCSNAPPRADATKAGAAPAVQSDALYRELGGIDAITKVVDLFLAKVDNDLRINLFFEKTDHKDLRQLVIEQFCEATGGPCKYTGRTMEEAHSGLNLSDADFAAFVEDLVAALDELKVPKASQDKLLALLAPMKPQVVGQ